MKIIDDIIDELTKGEGSLEPALLKTKVLAYKLDNKNLIDWTNLELKGYDINNVPDYRIVPCMLYGVLTDGHTRYNHTSIPTLHLGLEKAKELLRMKLIQNITGLEDLVKDEKSNVVIAPLSMDFTSVVLNQNIPLDDFMVESAQREIPKSAIRQAISIIRSKLLDFMLELNKEAGNEEITLENKAKVNELFTTNIIGDNNVFISGNHNVQKVQITVTKGDFKKLSKNFQDSGMALEDINELQQVIQVDQPDEIARKFGTGVNLWIKKMMAKAIDGGWEVSIGTAGTLLAEAISKYYGWS